MEHIFISHTIWNALYNDAASYRMKAKDATLGIDNYLEDVFGLVSLPNMDKKEVETKEWQYCYEVTNLGHATQFLLKYS